MLTGLILKLNEVICFGRYDAITISEVYAAIGSQRLLRLVKEKVW